MNRPYSEALKWFGSEDVREIIRIYDSRTGGFENVDREALNRIYSKYPDVSDKVKEDIELYAAFTTR